MRPALDSNLNMLQTEGVRTWSARNARHRWIPLVSPG
jgi:hypothetical protein